MIFAFAFAFAFAVAAPRTAGLETRSRSADRWPLAFELCCGPAADRQRLPGAQSGGGSSRSPPCLAYTMKSLRLSVMSGVSWRTAVAAIHVSFCRFFVPSPC